MLEDNTEDLQITYNCESPYKPIQVARFQGPSSPQKMNVSLARSSLLHEGRRYLAAVLAVSFAGLLLIVQMALQIGRAHV